MMLSLATNYDDLDRLVDSLPGWCSLDKARHLARLAVEHEVQSAVELGVFGGRSLVAIAAGLSRRGQGGGVVGFDPYTPAAALEGTNDPANDKWWSRCDYGSILHAANAGIDRAGLRPYARIVVAKSLPIRSDDITLPLDLLHQDSNHSQEVSCAEVEAWMPLLRAGGVWVLDDADWSSTQAAQRLLEKAAVRTEDYGSWAVWRKR